MSQAATSDYSFLAVRHRGALPRAYRWAKGAPESGSQIIVERPGGGEEVVTVVGHYDGDMEGLSKIYHPDALINVNGDHELSGDYHGFDDFLNTDAERAK